MSVKVKSYMWYFVDFKKTMGTVKEIQTLDFDLYLGILGWLYDN
jgi:hypothetical protein